ncbi:MAG: tetratricopeptide repeat protein [Candidatus Sericytochromatia bacterium]
MKKSFFLLVSIAFIQLAKPNYAFAFLEEIPENSKKTFIELKKNIENLEKKNTTDLLNLAYLYDKNGDFEKSLYLANYLISNNPNNSEANFLLGEIYFKKYNLLKAKEFFEKITFDKKEYNKAILRLLQISIFLQKKDDADKILEIGTKINNEVFANLINGIYNYSLFKNDFNKAIFYFEKALKKEPNNVDVLYYTALAYLTKDKRSEAKELLNKIIKNDFYFYNAYSSLAFIEFLDKEVENSIKNSKLSLSLNPYSMRALINLGNGMTNKTYINLEKNIDLKPNTEFFEAGIKANKLINENKKDEALNIINDLVKKYPKNIHSYIHLCNIQSNLEDYENAIKNCGKAVNISSDYGLANALFSNTLKRYIKSQNKEIKTLNLDIYDYSKVDMESLKKVFINYENLPQKYQKSLLYSIYPLRNYLSVLAKKGATHYIIPDYEKLTDTDKTAYLKDQKTIDGRLWDDVKGMGGFDSATGIEDLEDSLYFDFNTLAHELTHQVHGYALDDDKITKILELYENAKKRDKFLDYYSKTNEYEYFAQGVEAYISVQGKKNPKSTAKNTPELLKEVDIDLYNFIKSILDI